MLSYIIQTMVFQLLFLVVYDVFLKKETFFNWNRVYLLLTPLVSLTLPFVELQSFKTTVPQDFVFILSEVTLVADKNPQIISQYSVWESLNTWHWILLIGSSLSLFWFIYKYYQIIKFRQRSFLIIRIIRE